MNFLELEKKNSYSSELEANNREKFLYLTLMLDSGIKHYSSKVYGIIDAIGTLGGVFEIIFWAIMLFYSNIRT